MSVFATNFLTSTARPRKCFSGVRSTVSIIGQSKRSPQNARSMASEIAPCTQNHKSPAVIRFSRPHTVIGTTISVCSMTLLGASGQNFSYVLSSLTTALVPAILMNIGIVGINQIYDKKIDMVNKPYLPLASGEFSSNTALFLVSVSVAASLILGALCKSNALMCTLIASLVLGVLYSVDWKLLRWKRFPILAASCIIIVRAFTVHIGFFLHASATRLQTEYLSTLSVILIIMSLYSVVIALFKDLPDTSGDSLHGIETISVRFGIHHTFIACVWLLFLAQLLGAIAGFYCTSPIRTTVMVLGHLGAALVTLVKASRVDICSSASLHAYYMSIWRLFYLEYFLLPFVS